MTETKSIYEYQVGGILDGNAPSYVTREADIKFYQALKAGQFCYVLNSRQMGKSSLRVRTMQRLQKEGTVCVFIDLTGMGTQNVTPEKWYGGIVQSLVSSCQLKSKNQWRIWWRERRDLLSPVQRLSLFIKEILLVEIQENIVVFVDEIDRVLSQKFSLDDFFGLIRYCHDQRNTHVDYQRLTFALLGVATPSDLIQDKIQTPFNIGQAIQLRGFTFDEVQPLIEGLQDKINYPEVLLKDILRWTGGQPFLTQKLCQLVIRSKNPLIIPDDNVEFINKLVHSHIIGNWEVGDEPEHLRTIRDRILRNKKKTVQLLGLYQKILEQGAIVSNGNSEQMQLRLSGLVVEKQGKLKVYNPIYEAIFDKTWVKKKLEQVRPYATAIAAWIGSNQQDQSCLLQGLEWNLLDLFFRLRPLETPDPRITIVTIDERDIREVGQWPLPDGIVAEAIAKIKAENPQAIGLDVYRDLPVEPGHTDLVKLFQSSTNLFGVEKVVGTVLPPPRILKTISGV